MFNIPKSRYFHARAEENFHDQSGGEMPAHQLRLLETQLDLLSSSQLLLVLADNSEFTFSKCEIEQSFETFL